MTTALPLQFGLPGGPEVLIILLIAVLLFGANKIPKLARSTGEAMGEFQKGRQEVEDELKEMKEGPSTDPEESDEPAGIEDAETATDTEPDVETEDDDVAIADAEADAEVADAETEETN